MSSKGITFELCPWPSTWSASPRCASLPPLSDLHEPSGNFVSKNAVFEGQYLAGCYGADPYFTRIEEWKQWRPPRGAAGVPSDLQTFCNRCV